MCGATGSAQVAQRMREAEVTGPLVVMVVVRVSVVRSKLVATPSAKRVLTRSRYGALPCRLVRAAIAAFAVGAAGGVRV